MIQGAVLECAFAAAEAASAVHARHLGGVADSDWTEKGVSDFVTFVDQDAEQVISERIRRQFPEHHILAEEDATAGAGADWIAPTAAAGWTWIVDPLDGTTNYLHGYPMYAVSIAASLDGVLQVGVVRNSISGDVWHAVLGSGSFLNGTPVHVSSTSLLKRSLIGTGYPFKALHLLPQYLRQLDRVIRNTSGVRRAGSAALDLCHVATGWFDGFWELSLQPWDIAAGALILREAGGIVTTMEGSGDVVRTGSLLAGNPVIYEALALLMANQTGDAGGNE